MRGLMVAGLAMMLLGGCVGAPVISPASTGEGPAHRPVVIALIDSGTSPYLPSFQASDASRFRAAVPVPFEEIPLSGHARVREELYEADPAWSTLEEGRLYHFGGTRVFAISFHRSNTAPYNWDANGHGTATSYLAAREAPEAVVVMVQASLSLCKTEEGEECLMPPSVMDAMEWVADQEWIDVVSVSLGIPGNPPDPEQVHPESRRWLAATKRAADSGKLIVMASGNTVTPTLPSYFSGPPWVIAVGGIEEPARGEAVLASKGVDVVANFTESTPRGYVDGGMTYRSGTSFAAPVVAGTLANALEAIRAQDPSRVTSTKELRDGLNASATVFSPTEWDPLPPGREELPWDVITYETAPILVQPQMGWGYVNASLAPEIARRVLEQDFSIPPGKEQAQVFQPAWQRARGEFWARWAP